MIILAAVERRNQVLASEGKFWSRVNPSLVGCWNIGGRPSNNGYPTVSVGGSSISAHRYSWELHLGPVTGGLWVLHHCDNRRCVRPDHLYLGTPLQNATDMMERHRHASARQTHCVRGHEFTADNIYRPPATQRRECRVCRQSRFLARRQRGSFPSAQNTTGSPTIHRRGA